MRQVAATMFAFGSGAALPLLLLDFLSRETMAGWRNRLVSAGNFVRAGLGILLIAIGALAIPHLNKFIETVLVAASPQWLTDLTTRF